MKFRPGRSLWNHRRTLADVAPELRRLYRLVDRPVDLDIGTWAQLFCLALDVRPSLIVELGRGAGNSTVVFTLAAHQLRNGKVLSVDRQWGIWNQRTEALLRENLPSDWFEPLEIRSADILDLDFQSLLGDHQRILFFWDAHGADVAEAILSRAMPLLEKREHLVVVHDISDARYHDLPRDYARAMYGDRVHWHGSLSSPFEEIVPLGDFLDRNAIAWLSAEETVAEMLGEDPSRSALLEGMWGEELKDGDRAPLKAGHYILFSLQHRRATPYPIAYPPSPAPATAILDQHSLIQAANARLADRRGATIVAYGAGADFGAMLVQGLFQRQRLVGVLDDGRPVGSSAFEVPVIAAAELATLRPDILLIASSTYAPILQQRAFGIRAALGLDFEII